MSQLMFEDIVDFVEDYPREFRAQFARMKFLDTTIRGIIERFHEKRKEVFDNPSQRASEKLESLKSLDSEYLGKAEELQIKKLQILKALKHAVNVVQRKINDSVEAHRQELRFEHPGAAERIEFDSRQLDIDQDATVKHLYKDLIPPEANLSTNSGGASSTAVAVGANQVLTSFLDFVPSYFRSPGIPDGAQATAAGTSGTGKNSNDARDETESLDSGRVRSDGGAYDEKGYEKKRGRGRPRRTKDLDDGGASLLSGIDEDETASASGIDYAGIASAAAGNSKAGGANTDEELWCFCKQPSFGFMVACDADECPVEWFHGDCVHVSEEDMRGVERWFCHMCREKLVQMHAGNITAEALNNSNVDANERAQNALETMSQGTTTSSAAGMGGGKLRLDDEASSSTLDDAGFSGSRKRKRVTYDKSASQKTKQLMSSTLPNFKTNIGRPPKKSRK